MATVFVVSEGTSSSAGIQVPALNDDIDLEVRSLRSRSFSSANVRFSLSNSLIWVLSFLSPHSRSLIFFIKFFMFSLESTFGASRPNEPDVFIIADSNMRSQWIKVVVIMNRWKSWPWKGGGRG